jgi:hypothetical protein
MCAAACLSCGGTVSGAGGADAGGADAGNCLAIAACGGDVVGTWTLASACTTGHLTRESNGCAITNTFTGVAPAVSGTTTFGADGTFTVSQFSTENQSIDVSPTCLSMGQTCAQFASANLAAWTPQCSPTASGGCACAGSIQSGFHQFGTYSTSVNTLIETVNGGTPVGLGYCVQSAAQVTQLTLIGATAMGPMGGDTKYTVLTKP